MPATPISQPAAGESLLGTEPELLQQVDPGWRHRLNLFTGRALTDTALDSEQIYRAGLLTALAQSVTPGTVSGLALTLDIAAPDPLITVSPGYGIAATGADVVLNRTLKTPLSTVAVINGIDGGQDAGELLTLTQYHQGSSAPGSVPPSFAGILLLQPVIAQVSGEPLDTGAGPIEVSGNLAASCSTDTSEFAFDDWQIADAVRLVYLPWPTAAAASTSSALSLGLPLPALAPAATLRNHLAYSIFSAEALLGPDDQFPWAMLGVPLALVAFDSSLAWKPIFVDQSSVVRAGGLPRRRYVLPAAPPPLQQWQPFTHFDTTEFLVDSNNNIQTVKTAGTSGAPPPKWATTFGLLTPDGSVAWSAAGPANWQPSLAVAAGQFLYDDAGNLQYAVAAGTTGTAEPDWNAIYLPTADGTVTWINNGAGTPPLVQPALAEARIRQLSEQLGDTMSQGTAIVNLTTLATVLPPSGLLPVAAVNFTAHTAPWLPANWEVLAAPVLLEELEAVITTGITAAPLSTDPNIAESVEVLVPLPDTLYDPNILVTETVAPIFQQEVDAATAERNLTLQQLETVESEVNSLLTAIGPNQVVNGKPVNANSLDVNAGLTADELAARNTPPPYVPSLAESFGTAFPTTWQPNQEYDTGDFILDGNGGIQVAFHSGTSGANPPVWNNIVGTTTTDSPATSTSVTWINNGPFAWQPNTAYVNGQFVIDAAGNIHSAYLGDNPGPGISASTAPDWNAEGVLPGSTSQPSDVVSDGVVWQSYAVHSRWLPDSPYDAGDVVLDTAGNIQILQNAGISGDFIPTWNPILGFTTSDGAIVWRNLGRNGWQPNTPYAVGQAILDPKGIIHIATVGGTSGPTIPAWVEVSSTTDPTGITLDASLLWLNRGYKIPWAPKYQYKPGQIILDSNGMLQTVTSGGGSGTTQPVWSTDPTVTTPDANIHWQLIVSQPVALQQLQLAATQAPYIITVPTTATTTTAPPSESLINTNDLTLLTTLGLQPLITSLQARISRANDLVDMAFLTVQTDIYRFRQNVLGATAATALATSPVLANIAQGETANATSENLQSYYQSLYSPTASPNSVPAPGTTGDPITYHPITFTAESGAANTVTGAPSESARTRAVTSQASLVNSTLAPSHASISSAALNAVINTGVRSTINGAVLNTVINTGVRSTINLKATELVDKINLPAATQIINPGVNTAVISTDITAQSPLVGAQLNLRTLGIAERLQQSASQEAMFYGIANRLGFINSLVALEADLQGLGFVIDDLPVTIDDPRPTPPAPVGILSHTIYDFKLPPVTTNGVVLPNPVLAGIQTPNLIQNPPEATLFSTGVRVVEQHTTLLRALEARIQQYSNYLTLCTNALASMQSSLASARAYIAQLTNKLTTERQNVAFTTALLADETNRVASVNAQRQSVLATSVQLIAYTRARTLEALETTPSRQLVPANIASPVPACLSQSVSIPPELREIVAQLREAPIAWLPACAALLQKLERSTTLVQLAIATQARAEQQLKLALLPSSASQQPTVFATSVAQVYTANQKVFRSYQVQRAAFQPAAITNLAWSQQLVALQRAAALNDLISAEAVHAEVSNAVARIVQQISSVATCLYTRVSAALPIDRLAWAEFLQGPGASISLASLATLPSFNTLSYTDRQQMQLLVDWLFQQIDSSQPAASAFVSDVIRTAILLASDVPLDNIIPTNILQRTQPTVGGLISLNLASDRVASGMIVNLYSAGTLAARGVVSDHDTATATATVTNVFQPNLHLETTDIAHFTAQTPNAVALKSFFAKN